MTVCGFPSKKCGETIQSEDAAHSEENRKGYCGCYSVVQMESALAWQGCRIRFVTQYVIFPTFEYAMKSIFTEASASFTTCLQRDVARHRAMCGFVHDFTELHFNFKVAGRVQRRL